MSLSLVILLTVSVPADREITYGYWVRDHRPARLEDPENGTRISEDVLRDLESRRVHIVEANELRDVAFVGKGHSGIALGAVWQPKRKMTETDPLWNPVESGKTVVLKLQKWGDPARHGGPGRPRGDGRPDSRAGRGR